MKRYLDLLKLHYEKLILSVVLLGLAGAVGFLPLKIAKDRQELRDLSDKILNRPVKEMAPLDLAGLEKALSETKERFEVQLSAPPHNTVNPVEWHRERPGAPLQRSSKNPIGASRVEVTKLTPLFITVTWVSTGEGGSNYVLRMEDQTPVRRVNSSSIVNVGGKFGPLTLKEARVGANNTTELVCEFTGSPETFSLSLDTPYRKVAGHTADLKYDLENKKWPHQRVGDTLKFANSEFTISAINAIAPGPYEVVLSSKQTGKKTTLPFHAVPQP